MHSILRQKWRLVLTGGFYEWRVSSTREALGPPIVPSVSSSIRGVVHQKSTIKPMQQLPKHLSNRCGAHSRRTGKPCRNGAMKNGRCRMHGGKSTGAPKGNRNALKHGNDSGKERARRAVLRFLLHTSRNKQV